MFLIAESGSSKTQWRLVDGDVIIPVETKGINPFFASEDFILNELRNSKLDDYRNLVQKIVFYGSGCSHDARNNYLRGVFQRYFIHANEIYVDHDMLAACIALFGEGKGIACILGTGSNSCVYQNGVITQNVPALGYILGDEASGSYIGKEILKHYIYRTLPEPIQVYIEDEYSVDKEAIFDAVYKKPHPNRFLASFAKVASQFRDHAFIQGILTYGFDEFIRYHVVCYPEVKNYPIGFVGSIASVFEEELFIAMKKYELSIFKIDQNPIDALMEYHLKK